MFSIDSDSSFEANFVLATLADQQNQSQVPSQARLTQKRYSLPVCHISLNIWAQLFKASLA